MIHSVVSLEDIFRDSTELKSEYVKTSGGYAEYVSINGQRKLQRLISTNPADYLKAEYQPTRYYF